MTDATQPTAAQVDISPEAVECVVNSIQPRPGVSRFMTEEAVDMLRALRSALTASDQRAEDLYWKLHSEQAIRGQTETALTALKATAEKVVEYAHEIDIVEYDKLGTELAGRISDLEDSIPCPDCFCGPCECPNV